MPGLFWTSSWPSRRRSPASTRTAIPDASSLKNVSLACQMLPFAMSRCSLRLRVDSSHTLACLLTSTRLASPGDVMTPCPHDRFLDEIFAVEKVTLRAVRFLGVVRANISAELQDCQCLRLPSL